MVTKTTLKGKYVGWIQSDLDNAIYNHFHTSSLILILMYLMLAIEMPQGKIYKLTIAMLMRSVLTFDIAEGIAETWKFALVCCQT